MEVTHLFILGVVLLLVIGLYEEDIVYLLAVWSTKMLLTIFGTVSINAQQNGFSFPLIEEEREKDVVKPVLNFFCSP